MPCTSPQYFILQGASTEATVSCKHLDLPFGIKMLHTRHLQCHTKTVSRNMIFSSAQMLTIHVHVQCLWTGFRGNWNCTRNLMLYTSTCKGCCVRPASGVWQIHPCHARTKCDKQYKSQTAAPAQFRFTYFFHFGFRKNRFDHPLKHLTSKIPPHDPTNSRRLCTHTCLSQSYTDPVLYSQDCRCHSPQHQSIAQITLEQPPVDATTMNHSQTFPNIMHCTDAMQVSKHTFCWDKYKYSKLQWCDSHHSSSI